MNLASRLNRLEKRLGPPPAPISRQVYVRALRKAFTLEELTSFQDRLLAAEASGTSPSDIYEGLAERQYVLGKFAPALDAMALEMTGKSYEELLREEGWRPAVNVSDRLQAREEGAIGYLASETNQISPQSIKTEIDDTRLTDGEIEPLERPRATTPVAGIESDESQTQLQAVCDTCVVNFGAGDSVR